MFNSKKSKIKGLFGLMGVSWLVISGAVAASQRKLVFNPTKEHDSTTPVSEKHKIRHIVLHGRDGTRLEGWFMVPKSIGPHPVVIYFGGRSEDVFWITHDAHRMYPGMAVVAVNYRGYGDSEGRPGEQQLVDDARIIYDWVKEVPHINADKLAIVGRSLGSGVAVQLACEKSCSAVVLLTPYDSILAIAKKRFRGLPVSFILRHKFESIKYANKLTAPVYVFRSETDDIVPHAHTNRLVSNFKNLVLDEVIVCSNHCDIPYLASTQNRVAAVLSDCFGLTT